MRNLGLLIALLVIPAWAFAEEEAGEWTALLCPPSRAVNASVSARFDHQVPQGWVAVPSAQQNEKWEATQLVSSGLALRDGTLHFTCTYATAGELLTRIEQAVPQAELKYSECLKQNVRHCALRKGNRKQRTAEYACLLDVKLHAARDETQMFLPFGAMTCADPTGDEKGCYFKCRP